MTRIIELAASHGYRTSTTAYQVIIHIEDSQGQVHDFPVSTVSEALIVMGY